MTDRRPSQSVLPQAAFKAVALAVWLGMASLFVTAARAQLRDSFEGPGATWSLKEADCGVKELVHQRTYTESHTGQASEYFQLAIGSGTKVYLVQPIGKVPIIAELRPSLWVKASRPSIQFMVRVVYPRSLDPGSRQPVTSLLRGDLYVDVGEWQQLLIREPAKLLEQDIRSQRTRFGADFDGREAYLDLLVVNAYSAPGNLDLWLDDLEIAGYVNLEQDDGPQIARRSEIPTQPGEDWPQTGPTAELQGSLLLVRGRPFAPRMIQHQGEPLEWLAQLGFNTIKLSASPSQAELSEAERLGLWLIAPPPYGDAVQDLAAFRPVIGWSVGWRLTARDLVGTKELVSEIRQFEPNQQRPLVAGIDSGLGELSRLAPLVVLERPTTGTSAELANLRHWLLARPRLARPGTPVLASIPTQRPERLTEQLVLLSHGAAIEDDVDPQQLRLAAYSAMSAGARGLLFPSQQPLAIDSGAAALRTDALKLLNLELKLLEPWVAAGSLAQELGTGDGSVQVSVIATERSRLLLVTQHAAAQQYVLGPPPRSTLQINVPGVSTSDRAYLVSLAGIKQLRVSHNGNGANLTVEAADIATAIVVTQDPLAMHHLGRTLAEIRAEGGRLRHDLTVRRMARTVEYDQALAVAGRPLPSASTWLREAQAHLDQARKLLESNDYENLHPALAKAESSLAKIRRGHWEQAAAGFPSPAASPGIAQFTALPLHWHLAQRLAQGRMGPNEQVGGDMEQLAAMLAAGWKQDRQLPAGITADVSLSLQSPRSGRSALRMQAWPADPKQIPRVIEQPIVWISSSPVPVRQGQIARIHAWVHVPKRLAGTDDGLLVFDSIAGPELGDRVQLTQGWRELTLYRAVPKSGDLTVTFALTGLGEAWVDDLSVSLLDPEPIRPASLSQPTNP
jgi:hypothetical protein